MIIKISNVNYLVLGSGDYRIKLENKGEEMSNIYIYNILTNVIYDVFTNNSIVVPVKKELSQEALEILIDGFRENYGYIDFSGYVAYERG